VRILSNVDSLEIPAGESRPLSSDTERMSDALNHKASSLGLSTS